MHVMMRIGVRWNDAAVLHPAEFAREIRLRFHVPEARQVQSLRTITGANENVPFASTSVGISRGGRNGRPLQMFR